MAVCSNIKEKTKATTPPATISTPAYFGAYRSATMAFQVFRGDQHPFEVSTVTLDQVPWFKGNEVAACLGYARPRKAVYDNVDEEDKKTYEALIEGRPMSAPLQISNLMRSTSTSPASTPLCYAPRKGSQGLQALGHLRGPAEHLANRKLRTARDPAQGHLHGQAPAFQGRAAHAPRGQGTFD